MVHIAKEFVDLFGLEISKSAQEDEVLALLAGSIQAMIFNITAIACLVALLQEHKKVLPADLAIVTRYIRSKCLAGGEQAGGGMALDYFGYAHPAYSVEAGYTGTVMSQVDFAANVARPALGMTGGGTSGATGGAHMATVRHLATHSKEAARMAREVVSLHDSRISKSGMGVLLHIVDIHLNCFSEDLAAAGPLTPKKIQKAMSLRRNLVMQ